MTAEIQYLQKHMEIHPRNVSVKVFLKELIDKRKKYLKLLRKWDYKRFEWVLERLNLTYTAEPEYVFFLSSLYEIFFLFLGYIIFF